MAEKSGKGDDANAGPALFMIVNELLIRIARFEFSPEAVHFAVRDVFVGEDVMKDDEAAGTNEGRPEIEIRTDTNVTVIAVDE